MKVYVAGAWVEKDQRAVPIMHRLREAGVEITHDWTKDEHQSSAARSDADMKPVDRFERANADQKGVVEADCVWLLAPHERGASGAWTEFGMAIMMRDVIHGLRGEVYDLVSRSSFSEGMKKALAVSGKRRSVIVSGALHDRTIFTTLADWRYASDAEALEAVIKAHRAGDYER